MHFSLLALLPLISAALCPAPKTCNPLLPSTYISTAFTATRPQVDSYAKQAHEKLISYADLSTAAYDKLRGTKDFMAQVSAAQDGFAKITQAGVPLVNEYNDDAGWAALANLRAYEAYGDKKYLDRAIGVWKYLDTQCIDQAMIDKGYLEGTKNPDNKLVGSCNGKSMIGGVYWVNGLPGHPDQAKDGNVNAVSTGLHSLLSAELCQITKDQKYCTSAYISAQWQDRHMVQPNGLLYDGIKGGSCEITDWTFTYNAGLYIATYALLGSLTSNATATALAERTAKQSMIHPDWHADSGVIKEGGGPAGDSNDGIGFKSVLVRGLYRSWEYFWDEQLKHAIREYINIQYYGLTQLASDDQKQPVNFGRTWSGPKFELSTSHAQLAALDVANAISINCKSAFLKEARDLPVIKTKPRVGGC